ncbi:hypothetical protein BN946_scf185012.g11 [Trametes cinnabarina]|uniref:Fatty acid desaturase domain-containing protein n=1 Tax=Pycnoporus cinnabarinus TaxID=5643 RepID=A0A060ST60_PYCCI|nr:hypothetical protein BN946_scf185012.g11 [Trametes cinnabarina]
MSAAAPPTRDSSSPSEDDVPEFTPMQWKLQDIRAAIPDHLFVRDTRRGLAWLALDLFMAACCWKAVLLIDPMFTSRLAVQLLSGIPIRSALTHDFSWWFQGLIFTGIWVIGHEVTHTLLWTPYFSWKISHHRHHCNHASMERDEVYVPKTRSDLGIPQEGNGKFDYNEYLGDAPIYTLFMLVRQQLLAFPAYLLCNVSGQKNYPKWTNHFDPGSILFVKEQRNVVLISNAGIAAMILLRGAAATVDRNFLGWMGRFFLHNVAQYHVIHHFFPKMPFYHGAEATKYLRAFIGEHYHYSDKPVFKALWESYNDCQFVEDTGNVLFYRDKKGQAVLRPAAKYRTDQSNSACKQG